MGIEYEVRFQGIKDKNLLKDLKEVSSAVDLLKELPPTKSFLLKRARQDIPKMLEILRANSFYKADINVHLQDEEDKVFVQFQVNTGPSYALKRVQIKTKRPPAELPIDLPQAEDLGLKKGQKALAGPMLQAKQKIMEYVRSQGYVFAKIMAQEVQVRHSEQSVTLFFLVHLGPRARFGKTSINGLQSVQESFVKNKITWEHGELYDPKLIASFRRELIQSELFSLVRIDHDSQLDASGHLPISVKIKERDKHRVSFGLGYDTDIGPGVRASWENINLMGSGENLRFQSRYSPILQEIQGLFRKPNFLRSDQSLLLESTLTREDTDAFTSRGITSSANLSRTVTEHLTLGAGLGYKGTRLQDPEGTETFHLLSLPSFLDWDTRDSVLDPSQGTNIRLHLTPFEEIIEEIFFFYKTMLSTKWYYSLTEDKNVIMALRMKTGSIWGASTGDIPADERFYAGGGGSVRGYPFQELGPQKEGDPFGGRSILEISSEIRWRWTENFGLTFFLDGGNAYESKLPEVGKKVFWGTGLGFRYYTPVGPLRFDLAFPLNEETDIDPFQIYISIGQAF